ncbi:hypothetical protein [Candidatus Odyssella thessalonicensis]|uniref:hypothetical protein n=1 Tax=Candidatus Odyssella thessalonicensis TaxID=84647 RepID=UPI000225AC3F|nr:hypothetical protein [Candidatus Odyssella thessalonicensis]
MKILFSGSLMLTTSLSMDAPHLSADTPGPGAALVKQEPIDTSAYAQFFDPRLIALPQFQEQCINKIDRLSPYLKPASMKKYIECMGQQFNSAFLSMLAGEYDSKDALIQKYARFYFVGLVNYARAEMLPNSTKQVFPSNLPCPLEITDTHGFKAFLLYTNPNWIDFFYEVLLGQMSKQTLIGFLKKQLYIKRTNSFEKIFKKYVMFETGLTIKRKRGEEAPINELHRNQRPRLDLERLAQPSTTHDVDSARTTTAQPVSQPPLPAQHAPMAPRLPASQLASNQLREYKFTQSSALTGVIMFANRAMSSVFYGDPLKATAFTYEQLEYVHNINRQLFELWQQEKLGWDNYQTAHFALKNIRDSLVNHITIGTTCLLKSLRGIEMTASTEVEMIFMAYQKKEIPAEEYAQKIYNALMQAYDLAKREDLLLDFFTHAFGNSQAETATTIILPHEPLMAWYQSKVQASSRNA